MLNSVRRPLSLKKSEVEPMIKAELLKLEVLTKCLDKLSNETPIRAIDLSDSEKDCIKEYQFLTNKKVIYVCNVSKNEFNR